MRDTWHNFWDALHAARKAPPTAATKTRWAGASAAAAAGIVVIFGHLLMPDLGVTIISTTLVVIAGILLLIARRYDSPPVVDTEPAEQEHQRQLSGEDLWRPRRVDEHKNKNQP